jgi:SAM-dependent methyltransferase
MDAITDMDRINRKAWRSPATIDQYAHSEGWTDPGERAALERIALEASGEPILDIGVGGGRTVPLLRAISQNYVAIDYTEELVAACRARFPGVDVMHGDARDLSRFKSGSFKLVVFSFNGIDSINHEDRVHVLDEVYRVLRKGGVFLFSVHNKDGPGYDEPLSFGFYPTRNPFKLGARFLRSLRYAAVAAYNHRRYSRLNLEANDYAIMNASAHSHGILVHYTSLENELREIETAGFLPGTEVYENVKGTRVREGDDTHGVWWFHFLARK